MKLVRAEITDSETLLNIQKQAFEHITEKYGDFDGNPYFMEKSRMDFNIKYHLGKYYKVVVDDEIIGGIFGFELDEAGQMQIDQIYIMPKYQRLGYGTKAMEEFIKYNPDIKEWYLDTIIDNDHLTLFYERLGFTTYEEVDEDEGMKFSCMVRK